MKFEYDEPKNRINIEKHGIDFITAKEFDEAFDNYENVSCRTIGNVTRI